MYLFLKCVRTRKECYGRWWEFLQSFFNEVVNINLKWTWNKMEEVGWKKNAALCEAMFFSLIIHLYRIIFSFFSKTISEKFFSISTWIRTLRGYTRMLRDPINWTILTDCCRLASFQFKSIFSSFSAIKYLIFNSFWILDVEGYHVLVILIEFSSSIFFRILGLKSLILKTSRPCTLLFYDKQP